MCPIYLLWLYQLFLLEHLLFLIPGLSGSDWLSVTYLLLCVVVYPLFWALPSWLVSLWLGHCRKKWAVRALGIGTVFLGFAASAFLLLDAAILRQFGFHINGLVLNLLMTRGGFSSMGLDGATLIPGILGALILFLFHGWLLCFSRKREKNRTAKQQGKTKKSRRCLWYGGGWVACLAALLLVTGAADFYYRSNTLRKQSVYPLRLKARTRSLFRKLGLRRPKRTEVIAVDQGERAAALNYPIAPIVRSKNHPRYNIIWLTCESLRSDMLSPEVMPNSWAVAQKSCRFTRHYSGGNGTRPGVFSLFYGMNATVYWNLFLDVRRNPVFFDWLKDDQYAFWCQTSAHFTYPEFDHTVFASIPQECLKEQSKGTPWQRDAMLIDSMLEFMERRNQEGRPFFTFGFLESTHAPYNFPPDNVLRKNYRRSINYATVSAKDAKDLYARAENAAHYLDMLFARLYKYLAEHPELEKNTIVVLTGDHGEEFFEKGRLGHNSTFAEEQLRVPLMLKLPGVAPRVVEVPTHHTDVIPTLAPLLGVTSPTEDYAVGQNMLSPNYHREYVMVSSWDQAVLMRDNLKYPIPVGIKTMMVDEDDLVHRDDSPTTPEERRAFFETYPGLLLQIHKDLNRFAVPSRR